MSPQTFPHWKVNLMPDDYKDIMHLSRPRYHDLYPMPIHDRAAQFSPFAALVGYDSEVAETARLVDSKTELTEDEVNELNANLNRLLDMLDEKPAVKVTYFVPDEKKAGGKYISKTGSVRIFDSYANEIVFHDGARIAVEDLFSVGFEEK